MTLSRRLLIGTSVAALLAQPAQAFFLHGGGVTAVAPPVQLTSFVLKNTSGSTTGGTAPTMGHPFKKGDIPSGQYPILKIGSTVIPCSFGSPAFYSDGSMKDISIVPQLQGTIAGSASATVTVSSGGTAPAPSARTLAEVAANTNIIISATGKDNLSGVWTASLNDGITAANADNYVWCNGAAGKGWRIRASFKQSGSAHGQLECYFYIFATTDLSGNFGGLRYMARICQPWYNVASPVCEYRSFSALSVLNGATPLHDLVADMPSAKTFTWSGSGPTLTCTANGFQDGLACYLTTTGTLPAGLSTGQMYCTIQETTNSIAVGLNFSDLIQGNTSPITPTNAGTGTHTITMLPMVTAFGSVWAGETNGRWSYVQGSGSVAAESTILVQPNMTYWCGTKLLPPYALSTYTPASNPSVSYYCGTAGPYLRNIGQTGASDQIGILPAYFARHIFTNAAVDEQLVRVSGLIAGHLPGCLRDNTTHSVPNVGNRTYSGMPTANQSFQWYANTTNLSGFTAPTNTNVYTQGWSYIDYSHMPQWVMYPYLLTGEPQFMDLIVEYANGAIMHQYTGTDTAVVNGTVNSMKVSRNGSINSVSYAGIIGHGNDLLRSAAWPVSMLADAVGILPGTIPENASYHQYFLDFLTDTFAAWAGYRSMLVAGANSFVSTNGLWNECDNADGGVQDSWALDYLFHTLCKAYIATELTSISDHIQYCVKWPLHIFATNSGFMVPTYQAFAKQNGASCASNGCNTLYITADTQWAAFGWAASWNSGTGLFTITQSPASYTLNNGDVFMWNGTLEGTVPAGFNGNNTPYFVVNKSGSTFQLSATLGGSPIALTDTGSIGSLYGKPSVQPTGGFVSGNSPSGSSIPQSNIASFCWINALGLANTSALASDLSTRTAAIAGWTAAVNANPQYGLQATWL